MNRTTFGRPGQFNQNSLQSSATTLRIVNDTAIKKQKNSGILFAIQFHKPCIYLYCFCALVQNPTDNTYILISVSCSHFLQFFFGENCNLATHCWFFFKASTLRQLVLYGHSPKTMFYTLIRQCLMYLQTHIVPDDYKNGFFLYPWLPTKLKICSAIIPRHEVYYTLKYQTSSHPCV